MDECLEDNGGCQQTCSNLPGGYVCQCTRPGYERDTTDISKCISEYVRTLHSRTLARKEAIWRMFIRVRYSSPVHSLQEMRHDGLGCSQVMFSLHEKHSCKLNNAHGTSKVGVDTGCDPRFELLIHNQIIGNLTRTY